MMYKTGMEFYSEIQQIIGCPMWALESTYTYDHMY